jgi:hypothetical protein
LCSRCARVASGIRPVLSDPCPTFAHRANRNSFYLSDLRPVLSDLGAYPSDLGRGRYTPRRGFDSRRVTGAHCVRPAYHPGSVQTRRPCSKEPRLLVVAPGCPRSPESERGSSLP